MAQFLAFAAAAILVLAGIGLWADAGWWRATGVAGLGVSTLLLLLYSNPRYLFILAVNVTLLVGVGSPLAVRSSGQASARPLAAVRTI